MTNRKFNLAIPIMDLAMMKHALQIQSVTAMMCGNHRARKNCDRLLEEVKRELPPVMEKLEGEEWSDIGSYIAECKTWSVYLKGGHRSYEGKGRITIKIDDREWSERWDDTLWNSPDVETVRSILLEAANMDSSYIDIPNEVSKPWRWNEGG